jgi:hypothetical protein
MLHQQQQQRTSSVHYRQGDIIIRRISAIPARAVRTARGSAKSIVLGEGEVAGHRHEILEPGVEAYRFAEGFYLGVTEEEEIAEVIHPEHRPVALLSGSYEVIGQYEFVRKEFARVQD